MTIVRDHSHSIIEGILHPTDFSEGSLVAFHHALAAALTAKSELALLHVFTGESAKHVNFPGVRDTLEQWGLLPHGSPRSAVPDLGIEVRKVVTEQPSPVQAVLHYLERHPADLIVLAAHRREGRMAWLQNSVAEPMARKSGQMTLFIPEGIKGFVAAVDGTISLKCVLIPVAASPDPMFAIEAAARLVGRLGLSQGRFVLLHVGETGEMPTTEHPEVPGWDWQSVTCTGPVAGSITDVAHQQKADLIVMTTEGRRGFLDALRGSHSEQVLHHTPVPLLTVPAGSRAGQALESELKEREPDGASP